MSLWTDTCERERIARAKELLPQYEAVGWDRLGDIERGVLLALRWITLDGDEEPAEIDLEDYE